MQRKSSLGMWVTVALMTCLLTGCNQMNQGTDGDGDDSTDGLTSAEAAAVDAGLDSAESMSHAVYTSQAAASVTDGAGQRRPAQVTFGTCPEVTSNLSLEGGLTLDLGMDFGGGCPVLGDEGYMCSGSASGSISTQDQTLIMSFDNLSCADDSVTGSADLTWGRDGLSVQLAGDWNLTITDGEDTVSTVGAGTCDYDADSYISTVQIFDGTLTDNGDDYDLAMRQLQISAINNDSFIPFGGTLTIDGPTIREITVRFDENSPTTGDIEASIAGAPFVTLSLEELEALINAQ